MTQRSPVVVFLLMVVTVGIYLVYWLWVTANEMNRGDAEIPHPVLSLVPIVQIWWLWKWAGGVQRVTGGQWSQAGTFVLSMLLPGIGAAIVQSAFNRASAGVLSAAPA